MKEALGSSLPGYHIYAEQNFPLIIISTSERADTVHNEIIIDRDVAKQLLKFIADNYGWRIFLDAYIEVEAVYESP